MSEAHPDVIVREVSALASALQAVAAEGGDASLAVLEARVLTVVREAQGRLLGAVVQQSQRSLQPGAGWRRWCCPACSHAGRVERWGRRRVLTVCGWLVVERPWCRCDRCGQGYSPTDETLEMVGRSRLSAGATAWLEEVGSFTSFALGAGLLERLTGLCVSDETVRHRTEALGRRLEATQAAAAVTVMQTREPAGPVNPAPGQLVVETDGVMVLFLDGWHEVKLVVAGGYLDGNLSAKSFAAGRLEAAEFGPRLLAEAARRGALDIVGWQGSPLQRRLAVLRKVVVVGDGAHWIWNLAAEHFGDRVEIVDWYHACQHLWAVAKALWGDTPRARQWAERQRDALAEHGAAPVRRALARVRARTPEAALVLKRERGYFRSNAARMAYAAFRAAGYPIGSGEVESAARSVIQQRLKRAGARWSADGGQAMVNVCCHFATLRAAA